MDDTISRQAAIDILEPHNADYEAALVIEECIARIRTVPSIDAVEVVRCRDCKWYGEPGCAIQIIDDSDKPKEADFCSFAERKTDESD